MNITIAAFVSPDMRLMILPTGRGNISPSLGIKELKLWSFVSL